MHSRVFYLLLMAASCHTGAHAQLFKCKGADGRLMFQDVPCAAGSADVSARRKPAAAETGVAPPQKEGKAGANWDLGPRSAAPGYPAPMVAPSPSTPSQPVPPSKVAQEQRQRKQAELERQQAEQRKAEEEKAAAFNRMQRCNHARQQLGVVKTERPIYSYDNKGERQYVNDEDRQAVVAAAERRVAEECN